MSNIKQVVEHLPEPDRAIAKLLMSFYEDMKANEAHPGKQATLIVMAVNDTRNLSVKILKDKVIDLIATTIAK